MAGNRLNKSGNRRGMSKSPRLKKIEGGYVNQYGIVFSEAEKKDLESKVNTANAKRKRMLEAEAKLPRMDGGKDTGDTLGTLQLMGRESDFILHKKSKSLQRFKSKEQYKRYIENLQRVNDRNYIKNRVSQYKQNYITSLKNVAGSKADDIVSTIENMNDEVYMKLAQSNEELEIGYVYSPVDLAHKLNRIRAVLRSEVPDHIGELEDNDDDEFYEGEDDLPY